MIENFGLKSAGSAGTEIHLMTADDFAIWQAKASDACASMGLSGALLAAGH